MSYVSIADLADLVGQSRQTVAAKVRGLPYHSGDRNKKLFDSVEVLPILYGARTDTVDLNEARALLAVKQREKLEFDMSMKSDTLMDRSQAVEMVTRAFVSFRTRMLSIPTKASPHFAELDDPIDIQELLTDYLYECLEELTVITGDIDDRQVGGGDSVALE